MLISREYAKQQIGKQEVVCNQLKGKPKMKTNNPKMKTNTKKARRYYNDLGEHLENCKSCPKKHEDIASKLYLS